MAYAQQEYDAERDDGLAAEVQVVNVSPFVARFEIGTMPGTRGRKTELKPGETMYLQAGYCQDFIGESLRPVRATIESLTERHAWEGRNAWDKDGKPYWAVKPGPQLPMVVTAAKAPEMRARWAAAIAQHKADENAPLRMTLQRQDGTDVEVQAEIAPAPRRAAPVMQGGIEAADPVVIDEPPPDHNDPLDLPVATAPPQAPPSIPKRGGRQ
ncbi:MAG TPA: hypothetical protein VLN57_21125 [Xanthobacteraceae bacterium]|nr:hypothetical protein [Xanthobacteraceae bacterium]